MEPDSGWGGVEAVPGMQDTASALGASALMVRGSALSPCVLQTERGWRSRQREWRNSAHGQQWTRGPEPRLRPGQMPRSRRLR